ncbi:MAG: accessory gene regulator B family protein [Lachnospiraceae bacterium]|nr:accessory gene regulator B family protein [Lachnospiraceae bacterium]
MTDRILSQLIKLNIIDSEDEEIYRFGLEGISLKLIHYLSYFLIAVLLHEWMRFLIFLSAFLLLRKNAGGYHAKTKIGCYASSCLTVLCMVICIKESACWKDIVPVAGILMVLADIAIFALAPLGNRNRILDWEESVAFRRRSYAFLILENVFVILLVVIGMKEYAFPVVLAIICEAVLLLLEKMREGSNEVEQKINHQDL